MKQFRKLFRNNKIFRMLLKRIDLSYKKNIYTLNETFFLQCERESVNFIVE